MPKTDRPLYADYATGEIAGVLAFKKGTPFPDPEPGDEIPYGRIEKKRVAPELRSQGQEIRQNLFKVAKDQWNLLTPAEKLTYKNSAPAGMTGFNYYLSTHI